MTINGQRETTVSTPPLTGERLGEAPVETILHRLAAHAVRRQCNQHHCTVAAGTSGECEHPNHRRDIHLMTEMLAALGLTQEAVIGTDEEHAELLRNLRTTGPPPGVDLGGLILNGLQDR